MLASWENIYTQYLVFIYEPMTCKVLTPQLNSLEWLMGHLSGSPRIFHPSMSSTKVMIIIPESLPRLWGWHYYSSRVDPCFPTSAVPLSRLPLGITKAISNHSQLVSSILSLAPPVCSLCSSESGALLIHKADPIIYTIPTRAHVCW